MKKVIRDGMVAVLYSPRHGAGWYTWHDIEALIYDPVVVDMVEHGADSHEIESYCEKTYGDDHYYGGSTDLKIRWMEEGTEFFIDEYDGSESIQLKKDFQWLKT